MKIAFISDIHSNLPALEAVLEDIDQQQPDFIYCLGDLVGYNIWPNEVIQILRKRRIPTLAGNYDEAIGNYWSDCGCGYTDPQDLVRASASVSFTHDIIQDAERDYLRCLPYHVALTLPGKERSIQLLMVHGSPRKINECLFEDRPEKSLHNIFNYAKADIIVCAHTHLPYHRTLAYHDENLISHRHAINSGSVGRPCDGDPSASYVQLTFKSELSLSDPSSIQSEIRKVEYDVEKAAQAVEDSELPNEFADRLRYDKDMLQSV